MTITAPESDIDTTTRHRETCQGLLRTGESDAIPCDRPAEFQHLWSLRCCERTPRTVHCRDCSAEEVRHTAEYGSHCGEHGGPAVLVMVVPL